MSYNAFGEIYLFCVLNYYISACTAIGYTFTQFTHIYAYIHFLHPNIFIYTAKHLYRSKHVVSVLHHYIQCYITALHIRMKMIGAGIKTDCKCIISC